MNSNESKRDAPVEAPKKEDGICPRCHKAIRRLRKGSFTSWIFSGLSCTCNLDDSLSTKLVVASEGSKSLSRNSFISSPPDLGNRFQNLELIGEGGMGMVFKGYDTSIKDTVAVKILRPELVTDSRALKAFKQEAASLVNLSHPNIVSVYSHGQTVDGIPFLVMEYIDGESLTNVLTREGRLSQARALNLILQVCDALSHAHDNHVIHRDIKPSNAILRDSGKDSESVHLVDFGIAKVMYGDTRASHDLTEYGDVLGTPSYMSPEQCLGLSLNEQSDIYSLGCVLHECLTGVPPFESANPAQVLAMHLYYQPSCSSLSGSVKDVLTQSLQKPLANRYKTIDELRQDLKLIQSQKKPVFVISESRFDNKIHWTWRHLYYAITFTFMITVTLQIMLVKWIGVQSTIRVAATLAFLMILSYMLFFCLNRFPVARRRRFFGRIDILFLIYAALVVVVVIAAIVGTVCFLSSKPFFEG